MAINFLGTWEHRRISGSREHQNQRNTAREHGSTSEILLVTREHGTPPPPPPFPPLYVQLARTEIAAEPQSNQAPFLALFLFKLWAPIIKRKNSRSITKQTHERTTSSQNNRNAAINTSRMAAETSRSTPQSDSMVTETSIHLNLYNN